MRSLVSRIRRIISGPPPRTPSTPPPLPAPPRSEYFFLGEGLGLVRLLSGRLLYVDPLEQSVCAHLITSGGWETWTEQTVLRLLRPGDHVVEVGTHVGFYTVTMADRVGSTGSVTAFEANPRLARLASQSLSVNGFSQWAEVRNQAVADTSGRLQLVTSRRQGGGGHLYVFDNIFGAETELIDVDAVRLDDLDLPDVRFIRIDAEGSEPLILRGATRLLARPDIVLCIEWDVIQMGSRIDVPAFVSWLADQGFRFWRICHDASAKPVPAAELSSLPACDLIVCRHDPFVSKTT